MTLRELQNDILDYAHFLSKYGSQNWNEALSHSTRFYLNQHLSNKIKHSFKSLKIGAILH